MNKFADDLRTLLGQVDDPDLRQLIEILLEHFDARQPPSITCPTCGRVSYNHRDIEERYCADCGFHDGSLTKTKSRVD